MNKAVLIFCFGVFGCSVPHSSSIPAGVGVVGAGQSGTITSIEYPVVDVLATSATPPSSADKNEYPTSDFPYFSFRYVRGISDTLDLELGVDGTIYGIVPIPHGGNLGMRSHVYRGKTVDLGVAFNMGYTGFLATNDDSPSTEATVNSVYGTASASARLRYWKAAQPHLSVAIQPMLAIPTINGAEDNRFHGLAASTTLGVNYDEFGPFVTLGFRTSTNARGTDPFVSVGFVKGLPMQRQ